MPLMLPPRQWLARFALILAVLARATVALRFAADNEGLLEPGSPLNISWTDNAQDVHISLYVAQKVPGRAELKLEIKLSDEDQKNKWISWDAPTNLADGLYQFTVWNNDGADYWIQTIGDPSSFITLKSSGGLSGGAKAGIGISVTLIILGLAAAAAYVLWRRGIIFNRDRHTALDTPEPDAFLAGGRSSPKPPAEHHQAAEVSGDYTYHEMGGDGSRGDGMEMNTYPSAAQAAQAYSQPHNTPSYAQAYPKIDTSDYDQTTYDYDQRASNRYSQAVSQMSEPPDYGRSPDMGYSQTMSSHEEYPQAQAQAHTPAHAQTASQAMSPTYSQPSVMPYGHSYRSPVETQTEAQSYGHGHGRHLSDTEGLISSQAHAETTRSRRQSYQNQSYEAWPSPPQPAQWGGGR